MDKLTHIMKKLWRDPFALFFILLFITLLLGKPTIGIFEIHIALIIFFCLLFYYSWFKPEKLIHFYSTYEGFFKISSFNKKWFGDLNESKIFIPYMRFCAIVGLPIVSWLLYKVIVD